MSIGTQFHCRKLWAFSFWWPSSESPASMNDRLQAAGLLGVQHLYRLCQARHVGTVYLGDNVTP